MNWIDRIFGRKSETGTCKVEDLDSLLRLDDINDRVWKVFEAIQEAAEYGDRLEILSAPQKNIYFVGTFQGEVNHGGFDAFFFNSTGNGVHETLDALQEIEAYTTKRLLQEAVDRFPAGKVPKDIGARRDLLANGLSDQAEETWGRLNEIVWRHLEDDLDALCFEYIRKNRDAF